MDIKPFTIDVPEAELDDLLARIRNTRWPADIATDWSRGMPDRGRPPARRLLDGRLRLARPGGQRSTRFPQFMADVDGQPIHFVHVRSTVPGATPLLLLHGYPSSFVEATRMIGPLVDPAAHGARRGRVPRRRAVAPGLRLLDARSPRRAGRSRSPRRPSTRIMRRSATSGTASAAATSAPGWPSSCASRPATASSGRSSSPIPARSRRSTRRRPTT